VLTKDKNTFDLEKAELPVVITLSTGVKETAVYTIAYLIR
jgi:hypothetical protein